MGWASGSELAEQIWDIVKHHITDNDKQNVARGICDAFEDFDCDTIIEADDLFNTAYKLKDHQALDLIGDFINNDSNIDSIQLNSLNNWLRELPDRLN